MRNYILAGILLIALAGVTQATVLKLELPAEYDASMVSAPVPGDDAKLTKLFFDKLATVKEPDGIYVVVFTKNGEPLFRGKPENIPEDENPPYFGELEFVASPDGDPGWEPRTWADALWHLHEVYDGSSGVYELARDAFFGRPYTWEPYEGRPVVVELDRHYPQFGVYFASNGKIGLPYWRVGEGVDPVTRDTDRGMLTRCMLHAFRGGWDANWDQFDCGTVHAAWLAIQNAICGPNEEPGFNDLWHDEQLPEVAEYQRPEYMHLMAYNIPEMATRMPGFFSPDCGVDNRIMWARYRGCGYLWWKVFRQDNDFFMQFNEQLLNFYKNNPDEKPSHRALYLMALSAYDGGQIESCDFGLWFGIQPLLNTNAWCGEVCGQVTYRDKARVFAYKRYNALIEGKLVEKETPYRNKMVKFKVYDWTEPQQPNNIIFADTNYEGYAQIDLPYYGEDQRITVTAEVNIAGEPGQWEWSDKAEVCAPSIAGVPDDYELLGVTHDANEGTIRILHGPQYHYRPLVRGLFKLPNFDGDAGAGDYSITYIPPEKGGESRGLPHVVKKDGGNSVFSGNVISHEAPTDGDENGIPDVLELELAERFKPFVNMHFYNHLHPCTVDATLGTGYLVEHSPPGDIWYIITSGYPEHLQEMQQLFAEKAPNWDEDWFVTFGPGPGEQDVPEYWYNCWDSYVAQELFQDPVTYFNIFEYCGKPVIQYWFFYPFNDWGNDHEGDWEHINVRISGLSPNTSELDEVIYYFHYRRKSIPASSPLLQVNGETHPYVYVGGRFIWDSPIDRSSPTTDDLNGDCSGGSYWRPGLVENVGSSVGYWCDENIIEPVRPIPVNDLQVEWLGRASNNPHWWWARFPGMWGRTSGYLGSPNGIADDGPYSPWNHECWCNYQHPGYDEYEDDRDIASTPPLAGAGEPAPPSDAEPFGPPIAAYAPSPAARDYLSPTVRDYNSPVAHAPEGGGADLPPTDPPALTSPTNPGGDRLSPGAAAAPLERRGPLAAAASASPLACSPNPVTAAATISFKLEAASRVHLAVYDLSGRRVATLAEGPYAAGNHAAYWRADVPTGVYIYRLQFGDRVAVKKVVVAK
jgi:hypothetical protein